MDRIPGMQYANEVLERVREILSEAKEPSAELEALSDDVGTDKAMNVAIMLTLQNQAKNVATEIPDDVVDKAVVAVEAYAQFKAEQKKELQQDGSTSERVAAIHLRNIEGAVDFVPRLAKSAMHPENARAVEKSLRRMSLSLSESLSVLEELKLKAYGDFFNRLMTCAEMIISMHDVEGVHPEQLPAVARQCEIWVAQRNAGKSYGYMV